MELLKELYEKDIGIFQTSKKEIFYKLRKATRALIFNKKGQIAILFVSKNNYHKLPGGGIENNENLFTTLKREVLEEAGCNINIRPQSVGLIIEYRDKCKQLQISYCYLADVIGKPKEASFTKKEISDRFQLKWMNLDEAINTLLKDKPNNYLGKFIRKRDLEFLSKAKKIISK